MHRSYARRLHDESDDLLVAGVIEPFTPFTYLFDNDGVTYSMEPTSTPA